MSKGQAITGLMIGIATTYAGVTWVWNTGLSVSIFNDHATVSSLNTSVQDIKENTDGLPEMKAQLQFLAAQRGYKTQVSMATTSPI